MVKLYWRFKRGLALLPKICVFLRKVRGCVEIKGFVVWCYGGYFMLVGPYLMVLL